MLWSEQLSDINKSISQFVINVQANACSANVVPSAIVALKFMAADLPVEEAITVDELERLRKLCDELRSEILNAKELAPALKEWLLDLVRLMRDGIDRYRIRGSRGLRRQFHEMLGSLVSHEQMVANIKKEKPDIWMKVMNGFEVILRMAQFVEKGSKALEYVWTVIESWSGNTPSSPMLPPK